MMPVEKAILYGNMRRCALQHAIEANEAGELCMDSKHRNEMGAWRCLMFNAGVPKDQLPEMPFLEPAHLEEWHRRRKERAA